MSVPEAEIKQLVRDMNEAWLDDRIDDLARFFVPTVVLAPPDDSRRVIGRDAVVDSYRQYTEQAATHRFEERDLHVDVISTTAVAVLRFAIRYELGGSTYEEEGRDILVLAHVEESWRIVWRTQITDEAKKAA